MITVAEQEKLKRIREQRASIVFLVAQAYESVFEESSLTVEHSLETGYYCHDTEYNELSDEHITKLEATVMSWLGNDEKLELINLDRDEALRKSLNENLKNRAEIIKKWPSKTVPVIRYGNYWDLRYGPMTSSKEALHNFEIRKYYDGFLIRFPPFHSPDRIVPFIDQPKLFSVIKESEEKEALLGTTTIYSLNEKIRTGDLKELIWTAEGFQEKKISQIADTLSNEFPWKRVVTVAGPSSSGKTTFSKRLKIQLRVNGFRTITVSMDNYFLDREKIPFDKNGNQNFESLDALDTELLSRQVNQLIKGGKIKSRKFDFSTGRGSFTDDTIELGDWDFIILEGIHGLNPVLTTELDENVLQKLYVSAMTPLNIDCHHRVSTSDNRLLRRIIRDMKFRGYTVSETLDRWHSVREGEEKYIFPYQERADHIFNSALIYEPAVLAPQILRKLKINSGDSLYIQEEKTRLKLFLSFFEPVEENLVPGISILREFVGKSDFDY